MTQMSSFAAASLVQIGLLLELTVGYFQVGNTLRKLGAVADKVLGWLTKLSLGLYTKKEKSGFT